MLNPRPSHPAKTAARKRSSRRVVPAATDISRAENEGMAVPPAQTEIEGEGSYEAARQYNEGLERSVEEGSTGRLARDAADALDGTGGDALRKAERAARRGRSG